DAGEDREAAQVHGRGAGAQAGRQEDAHGHERGGAREDGQQEERHQEELTPAAVGEIARLTASDGPCDDGRMALTDPIDDPYTPLGLLREHDPLHWSGDPGFWIVTRYEDIAKALRDPRFRRTAPDGVEGPTWPADMPAVAS